MEEKCEFLTNVKYHIRNEVEASQSRAVSQIHFYVSLCTLLHFCRIRNNETFDISNVFNEIFYAMLKDIQFDVKDRSANKIQSKECYRCILYAIAVNE